MDHEGLQLEVRRFCGAPLITAKGSMDDRRNAMLRALLRSFKWKGHNDIILDLSGITPVGDEGWDDLMEVVGAWGPEMQVHLVATGEAAEALRLRRFPFRSHLCDTLDLAADAICRARRDPFRTLATVAVAEEAEELPLAA